MDGMAFSSILELYTSALAWQIYNLFFEIIAGTGLIIWPFLNTLLTGWLGNAEKSDSDSPAVLNSLQTIKYRFIVQFVVLIIAVVPLIDATPSNNSTLKYACGGDIFEETSYGSSGTTYDDLDLSFAEFPTKAPFALSMAVAIGNGINTVFVTNMPCVTQYAALDQALKAVDIDDPELKQQAQRFIEECHFEAIKRYHLMNSKDNERREYLQNRLSQYGDVTEYDLYSADFDFFKNTPGFYAECDNSQECIGSLTAQSPVRGFNYDANRDADFNQAQKDSGIGQPTCGQWWNQLRPQILNTATFDEPFKPKVSVNPVSLVADSFQYIVNANTGDNEKVILNSVMGNELQKSTHKLKKFDNMLVNGGQALTTVGVTGLLAAIPGLDDIINNTVGQIAGSVTMMYVAKQAIPLLLSLVIMTIICVMPLYYVASEYQISSVIISMIVVISALLFHSIWNLAEMLNEVLFKAIYPDASLWGSVMTAGIEGIIGRFAILFFFGMSVPVYLFVLNLAISQIRGLDQQVSNVGGRIANMGKGIGGSLGGIPKKTSNAIKKSQ